MSNILGTHDINYFLSCLVFAGLGAFLSLQFQANRRNINSTKSPLRFTYSFLILDNYKRLLTGFLLMFVSIRFMKELTGAELNEFTSLLAGATIDRTVSYFKKLKSKK